MLVSPRTKRVRSDRPVARRRWYYMITSTFQNGFYWCLVACQRVLTGEVFLWDS